MEQSETYAAQLQQRLNQLNLTVYGAAQIIAAKHDPNKPVKTVDQRIRMFLARDPKSIVQLAKIVEGLGGKLKIEWD